MIKNKKTLNFIGITTISLILATIGGACTPDTSEDEDDYESDLYRYRMQNCKPNTELLSGWTVCL